MANSKTVQYANSMQYVINDFKAITYFNLIILLPEIYPQNLLGYMPLDYMHSSLP